MPVLARLHALTQEISAGEIDSSIQSFDAADLGIGQESPTVRNTDALNASVATAQGLVTELANHLAGQGLDAWWARI